MGQEQRHQLRCRYVSPALCPPRLLTKATSGCGRETRLRAPQSRPQSQPRSHNAGLCLTFWETIASHPATGKQPFPAVRASPPPARIHVPKGRDDPLQHRPRSRGSSSRGSLRRGWLHLRSAEPRARAVPVPAQRSGAALHPSY